MYLTSKIGLDSLWSRILLVSSIFVSYVADDVINATGNENFQFFVAKC